MAIGEIFKEIEVVELTLNDDKSIQDNIEIEKFESTLTINDSVYLDFFFVFSGKCQLIFEVTKIFDPNQTDDDIKMMTKEEEERKDQIQILQRLGTRLNKLLIKPYFQTETFEEDQKQSLKKEDEEIMKIVTQYLKDPDNESDKFKAYSTISKNQTISDITINIVRPNYMEYYKKIYDLVTQQLSETPLAKYPRKVNKFDDRLRQIITIEKKSVLLRLPYKKMIRIIKSFWANYNQFADLLYNHVPLLVNYTLKQKQRMIQTFQEENFSPNQPLFLENTQLQYVYLIAQGQIKLTTTSNPYTQKYNKILKLNEKSEKLLLKNSAGLGNLSRTTVENNIGLVQQGQWLGEEFVLMKLPLLYTAIAVSDVKVLKVLVSDFQHKFTPEVHQLMQVKTMEKLDWIRERLETCHKIRKEIQAMDPLTNTFEKTFDHVKNTYPVSNTQTIHNIRKAIMKQSSNNPNLVMFTTSQRIEKIRENEEQSKGEQSFKSHIRQQENIKKLKLKLARALRRTLGKKPDSQHENFKSIIKSDDKLSMSKVVLPDLNKSQSNIINNSLMEGEDMFNISTQRDQQSFTEIKVNVQVNQRPLKQITDFSDYQVAIRNRHNEQFTLDYYHTYYKNKYRKRVDNNQSLVQGQTMDQA
ncbi:UNKNOWN [Stylonychia lemnae]|uniref:Cyclic nucleotide-binding domain-containing protein n=1 Tax=Stylonychia lemnae TaxID=5949 RepID=A0A078B9G8_STYLE|nr:UNKNOWN [Stylonychia lemnae]|eukprot:CDW90213.1 UNKNOWN [Stylonychia lemnae]